MDSGISIAIPAFDRNGEGAEFIKFSLNQLEKQTFKNFEVIISDDSNNDNIKKMLDDYNSNLDIKYFKSEHIPLDDRPYSKGLSNNANRALNKCEKEIIQILFQDDFLRNKNTLQTIYNFYKENNYEWAASCFYETRDVITASRIVTPVYTERIYLGENTMSGPSIISLRNRSKKIFFDEKLIMLMDCDFYKQMADKFGYPGIINFHGIVIRQHSGQISNNEGADPRLISKEIEYCKLKYKG